MPRLYSSATGMRSCFTAGLHLAGPLPAMEGGQTATVCSLWTPCPAGMPGLAVYCQRILEDSILTKVVPKKETETEKGLSPP